MGRDDRTGYFDSHVALHSRPEFFPEHTTTPVPPLSRSGEGVGYFDSN